ncbi:MAG: tyrosine-type recombinase/integrase [Nevskia sp.]|nr:tyrosine-type recombinase/integrase [Nevskia sp.]
MGARKDESDADRFLLLKRSIWFYRRRVPKKVALLDPRSPLIRRSLKTESIAEARRRRDQLEASDNALWDAMIVGGDSEVARVRYEAAVRAAEARGFVYRDSTFLARLERIELLLDRIEALRDGRTSAKIEAAILGGVAPPRTSMTEAYKLYVKEIAADEIVGKSAQQRRKWRNVKKRAVESFVQLVGDIPIADVTRDHALAIWRVWQRRVAPTERLSKPTHAATTGNRELGALRTIYSAYFKHMGEPDKANPFEGLSFKERHTRRRIRPPFEKQWLVDQILRPGALDGLNPDARGILLATIETGARPSELANLDSSSIVLDHAVPHISIRPREDRNNPRELKTEESERSIPLVGVALPVFQRFRDGFPRYREREEAASSTINKFLREHGLAPTKRHTLYSLRHSLEDRMKEAGIDAELRRVLMGHKLNRETYGTGGSLAWRRQELMKIVLPFDPAIV